MTRTIYLLVFMVCFGSYSYGQPFKHKPTTYRDSSGRFYINKSLPVYLHLAISPDPEAPSHKLKSEQTTEYANPMYFDTEGYNTIKSPWAVDTSTQKTVYPKRDIVFQVYADGKPPKLQPDFQGAEHYRDRWGNFYGKHLKILFDASDAVSGVKTIYYSLNQEDFKPFKDSIGFAPKEDGAYLLKYYAVDHVGNASAIDSVAFSYDTTPAKGRVVLYGVQEGENLLSRDSKLLFRSRDNLSGERAIYYSLDGKPYKKYTEPIPVGELDEGEHYANYYVIDNVGNVSSKNEGEMEQVKFDFMVDKSPPTVEIVLLGDRYEADRLYISEYTDIKVKAKDSIGTVAGITYNVNTRDSLKTYSAAFKIKGESGYYRVYAQAWDMGENYSPVINRLFYKDADAPVTSIDYINAHFFARDTLFIQQNTQVKLSARDRHSGVQQTVYRIDDEKEQPYDEPFSLKNEGPHTVHFYSIDRVNNQEQQKKSVMYLDDTPPRIYAHFSVKKFSTTAQNGQELPVYPTNTKIYAGATDKTSGTKAIRYSINGSKFMEHAGEHYLATANRFKKPGNYKVEIVAEDMVGNTRKRVLEFAIREK